MRKVCAALALLLCLSQPALAKGGCGAGIVPDAAIVGQGRMHYLFWDVYDATLKAPNGRLDLKKPYSITLSYLRDIPGKQIAEVSVDEMRKQGFTDKATLAAWEKTMAGIFPDVRKGDSLTGYRTADGTTLFCSGSRTVGAVKDKQFTQHFFAIWLDPKTSAPAVRRKMLGEMK